MSETGFTEEGYVPRDPIQLMEQYEDIASDIMGPIDYGPGSLLYQIFKVCRNREYEMELQIESMVNNMTLENARGIWLDKHGQNRGVFRKGSQKSEGTVYLTVEPPELGSTYQLRGITYFSSDDQSFERSEGPYSVRRYITITRGKTSKDGLPNPYVSITGVGFINSDSDGNGTSYTGDTTFDPDNQYFEWIDEPSISTGDKYYVEVTTGMTISDDVVAVEGGTGANVGSHMINSFTDNTSPYVPNSSIVDNPAPTFGGSDEEPDDVYRDRIERAENSRFTLKNIRSIAEGINGVKAAYVYNADMTDHATITGTWSYDTDGMTDGIEVSGTYSHVSGEMWNQEFSPNEGIPNITRLVLYGKRIGHPPPMVVGLLQKGESTYETSGTFDTYDVKPPATGYQDLSVNLEYMDMDHTENYQFDFWCAEKTGFEDLSDFENDYWYLVTGGISGTLAGEHQLNDMTGEYHDNLMFKTRAAQAGVKIDLALKDGYQFSNIESELNNYLDDVYGSGYAVAGMDYIIDEATEVDIYAKATLYVDPESLTSWSEVKGRVDNKIEKYINGLRPGDNVVYSKVYYNIMRVPEIWRVSDFYIYEDGGSYLRDEDINIRRGEIANWKSSEDNFDRG